MIRVGVPATGEERFAGAASAGYGYTESQVEGISAHHRVAGALGGGYVPVPWLEMGLRLDGRYDWHPAEQQTDYGLAGDPRALIRAGGAAAGQFHFGGEVEAWVPGSDAPSFAVEATTLSARLLGAWVANDPSWALAGLAGFRLDNSAKSAEDRRRYDPGDSVVLGVSDYNAVLLGLGLSMRVANTELLVEGSGDLLIGSGAPPANESPLRLGAGARHHLSESLQLQVLAEASLSSRPGSGPTDPWVPIEPRFAVLAGISCRQSLAPPPPPPKPKLKPKPKPKPKPKAPPPPPPETTVVGKVTDELGTPIRGAKIVLEISGTSYTVAVERDGAYRFESVPLGEAKVTITAEGFATKEATIQLGSEEGVTQNFKLEPALPAGQIRGMVRSFEGKPLSATIRVEPLGKEVQTDEQGYFQIDVQPGTYQITVTAEGYKEQRRSLNVREKSVLVFNADLTKQR